MSRPLAHPRSGASRKPDGSVQRWLMAGVFLLNAIMFAVGIHALLASREHSVEHVRGLTANLSALLEDNISNSTQRIDLSLLSIVDEVEQMARDNAFNDANIERVLNTHLQRHPDLDAIRITDRDGIARWGKGVNRATPVSYADRDYFARHQAHPGERMIVSEPLVGRISGTWIISFTRSYRAPDGSFAGLVATSVPIGHFTSLLSELELGAHGSAVIRHVSHSLISRFPPVNGPGGQTGDKKVSGEFRAFVDSGLDRLSVQVPLTPDGQERTVTFRRIKNTPFTLTVGMSPLDYLDDWHREVRNTVLLLAAFLVTSLVAAWAIRRTWLRTLDAQAALREQEARYRSLFETASDGIFIHDEHGFIECNERGAQMYGLPRERLIGRSAVEFAPERQPDGRLSSEVAAEMIEAAMQGRPQQFEWQPLRADGTPFDVDITLSRIELGGKPYLQATVRDISERKKTEAELATHRMHLEELVQQRTDALLQTEARASHIIQASADGLYGVDTEGNITFINPAGCAMLGYRAEQVIGRPAHALIHHSKPDGTPYPLVECPSHDALQAGREIRVDDEVYWHADGHAVPVMYSVHPMLREGKVTGSVVSFVDMSEQRAAALAREQALIAAENLVRVRSEFLANMSHEIRTPLNGVLGFAEIGYGNLENVDKVRNAFEKILASGNRLRGVIDDILDFSKIDAGKLGIEETGIVLVEVIDHALELVRERAAAKNLTLRADLSPDLPATCMGDPLRLGQVLINLLANSVKFTEAGSISLSVSRQGEQLVFTVSDTGIGMDEEQLSQLFRPFQQADSSATRRFGGTGLGLAISKRLLELMDGEIRVHSQPGVGSSFEFRLPYVAATPAQAPGPEAAEATAAANKPLAGMRILVAEDEAINQMVLAEYLDEAGASVVMVGNGREAVEQVRASRGEAFDLVLMDLQMPEMDGYEATRLIRRLAPGLPIIGQTAHALAEERAKCLAAGMLAHIAKPIMPGRLVALIRQHAPVRATA